MVKPKVIIMRTAGVNCDAETARGFELAGGIPFRVHVNELFSGSKKLSDYQILALPGGFSYGDDIASGKILANELRYKLTDDIKQFAACGKPVIGICNGFQVLVKSGLLPGFEVMDKELQATLSSNDSAKFEARWSYLEPVKSRCLWTRHMKKRIYLPSAHGEGKFIPKNNGVLKKLKQTGQIVLRYVNEKGKPAGYPHNPNGSVENIAGICNPAGNVFGLMPHPERHLTGYNHPRWTRERQSEEGEGLIIFKNAVNYTR